MPSPASRTSSSGSAARSSNGSAFSRRRSCVRCSRCRSSVRAGGALRAAGFRRAPDVQPVVATLELDLSADEDALLRGLDKDTRWSVRHAEKRGVGIRDADGDTDLRAFYDLYAQTGARAGFITRTWEYYRAMWGTLVGAGHARVRLGVREGRAVAAAMTWRCGEREVYQTAATNAEGRSAYAAYALLWRCIIEAKTSGAKRFDF